MVVIYLDKNRRCFPYSKLRTNRGTTLLSINPEEKPVQQMLEASGIRGFGCSCTGSGINILGSGALIPVCATDPDKLKEDYLVVRGYGIGSNFKKTGNRILAWSKKNVLPLLRTAVRKGVESGKRVGADVLADVVPHVATLGAQAIDKKYGNSLLGNVAQTGLAELSKTVQKTASDYANSQNKANPYSSLENRTADEIRRRSIARLQQEMKKNDIVSPARPKTMGKGLTQDQVMY